jgi:hypothetical protein
LFFIVLCFFIISCQTQTIQPKPQDTKLKSSQKNWELLYAAELSSALKNDDVAAYYFFWPLYLQARYENKCKQYNELHGQSCNCIISDP